MMYPPEAWARECDRSLARSQARRALAEQRPAGDRTVHAIVVIATVVLVLSSVAAVLAALGVIA